MSTPSRQRITRLTLAATLRASGATWQEIADKVGRTVDHVRHWPRLHPDEWSRAFRAAETHLLADAATESRQVLRNLLRSKAEPMQLAAAQQMLRARLAERAREAAADAARAALLTERDHALAAYIREVQSLTDEELAQELAREP